MITDPIADMLTRIRNANQALHENVSMPSSGMRREIARILDEEGYIEGYSIAKGDVSRSSGRIRCRPKSSTRNTPPFAFS